MDLFVLSNKHFYIMMIFTIIFLFLYGFNKNENFKKDILISKVFMFIYLAFTLMVFVLSI